MGAAGDNKGECPWPKMRRKAPSGVGKDAQLLGLDQVRDMNDERIEGRAALGSEYTSHRRVICSIRTEPIDGLGRKGNEPPRTQQFSGPRNCRAISGKHRHGEDCIGQVAAKREPAPYSQGTMRASRRSRRMNW